MWSIAEIIHIFLYWNQALQKGQEILLLSLRRLFEKGVWNDTLVIDIVFHVSKKNDPYYIWPQFKLWRGSYIYVHSRFGFHAKQLSEVKFTVQIANRMAFDVSTGRYVRSRIRLNFGHIFRQWANALQHQHKSGPGLHFTMWNSPHHFALTFTTLM